MSVPDAKLLQPLDYLAEAIQCINQARERITIISFVFSEDSVTKPLIESLIHAAQRGVSVYIAADSFTFGELAGHFNPFRYFSSPTQQTTALVRRLRQSGIHFSWLGTLSHTPFNGRTHKKWLIADDTVFAFGGINIIAESFASTDYMLRLTDRKTTTELTKEFTQLLQTNAQAVSNRSRTLSVSLGTILIDGGMPFDSLIYRRAKQLAQESSHVVLVSQYRPSGRLMHHVYQTSHEIYYNRIDQAKGLNRIVLQLASLFSPEDTHYTKEPYLHAKYILFYRTNAPTVVLTGSHNFMRLGTTLGTREAALESADSNLVAQFERYTEKYIRET